MVTKIKVLIISSLVTLFLVFLFSLGSDSCYSIPVCREFDKSKVVGTLNGDYLLSLFVFPPILILSLITFWMKEEIFRAWWSLARWLVPTIVVATLLIQLVPKNGGFFNMDALIYLLVLAPLYAIFILGSLWKIFRAYRTL